MIEFENIRKALLWLEGYCVEEPKALLQIEGIRQNLNRIEKCANVKQLQLESPKTHGLSSR